MRKGHKFHSWLFELLMEFFVNSGWVLVIKDFKKSKIIKERNYTGLTNYGSKTIYLDIDDGTPRILIHELGHLVLCTVWERAAAKIPWKELKKVRGRGRKKKEFNWEEDKVIEFTDLYYRLLDKHQIKILQGFIDESRVRYEEKKG